MPSAASQLSTSLPGTSIFTTAFPMWWFLVSSCATILVVRILDISSRGIARLLAVVPGIGWLWFRSLRIVPWPEDLAASLMVTAACALAVAPLALTPKRVLGAFTSLALIACGTAYAVVGFFLLITGVGAILSFLVLPVAGYWFSMGWIGMARSIVGIAIAPGLEAAGSAAWANRESTSSLRAAAWMLDVAVWKERAVQSLISMIFVMPMTALVHEPLDFVTIASPYAIFLAVFLARQVTDPGSLVTRGAILVAALSSILDVMWATSAASERRYLLGRLASIPLLGLLVGVLVH